MRWAEVKRELGDVDPARLAFPRYQPLASPGTLGDFAILGKTILLVGDSSFCALSVSNQSLYMVSFYTVLGSDPLSLGNYYSAAILYGSLKIHPKSAREDAS